MASSSFTTSHLIFGVIALVAGLALGGLGPRSELRALQQHVTELEQRDCRGGGSQMGREIASVLRGGGWGSGGPTPRGGSGAGEPTGDPEPTDDPADEPVEGDDNGQASLEIIGGPDPEDVDLDASMDQLHDALQLRRAQARRALIEQARLSDSQLDQVDAIVEDMNADLAALADGFVAHFQETDGQPDRREGMLFARDTLDVLVTAEDELWGNLEPGQREGIDDAALNPTSYIDGEVVEVLRSLEP